MLQLDLFLVNKIFDIFQGSLRHSIKIFGNFQIVRSFSEISLSDVVLDEQPFTRLIILITALVRKEFLELSDRGIFFGNKKGLIPLS